MEWPAPHCRQRRLLLRIGKKRLMAIKVAVLGIDLGKNSCSLVGLDEAGAVVKRRHIRPQSIPAVTSSLPACGIGIAARCGAHHLGRLLALQGHTVRLMSPEYVRPYVKSHKNDDRDAEAATRPTMRFVELKSERQLDMQTLHRARDRLVGERSTSCAPSCWSAAGPSRRAGTSWSNTSRRCRSRKRTP